MRDPFRRTTGIPFASRCGSTLFLTHVMPDSADNDEVWDVLLGSEPPCLTAGELNMIGHGLRRLLTSTFEEEPTGRIAELIEVLIGAEPGSKVSSVG